MTSSTRLVVGLLALLMWSVPALGFQVGEEATVFTLPNLAGEKVSLSDYRGKLVVLELGTTWCPGCRFQNKEMARIDEMFADSQVQVLEVFMQETPETVRDYFKDLELSDAHALIDDGSVQKGYNVYLIPRVVIIDTDGKVLFDAGMTEAKVIEEKLRALLSNSMENAN